jgi:hypothetical protein
VDFGSATAEDVQEVGIRRLLSHPAAKTWLLRHDRDSRWVIAASMTELSKLTPALVKGKIVLLECDKTTFLYQTKDVSINARQSRSHHFEVPDRDDLNVLDITVTVVFQGTFGPHGYRPGRLAASLFRLPDEKHRHVQGQGQGIGWLDSEGDAPAKRPKLPLPVGYAPYPLQSPNLPESLGRIVILHRPRARPLRPGTYRLVIGAASTTKYTVEVTCKYAQAALPLVDDGITVAREMQSRLSRCLVELENIEETTRLAERKLTVCRRLIIEAEAESQRCQKEVKAIAARLEKDEDDMLLAEHERESLEKSQKKLETE